MRNIRDVIMISILLLLVFVTCEKTDPKKAEFIITSKIKGMKSYGAPYVKITVENTGNATGYNVSCDVQAKKGNTIIDDGFAYFAGGGNIDPDEMASDEAVFFDLNSHNDYDKLEYELDWITR